MSKCCKLTLVVLLAFAGRETLAQQSDATRRLLERNDMFEPAIIEVAENVYTAIGYQVSTNTMIVGNDGVLNEGGLRYGDEFVRHKALDCIGDLYLAGAPILGSVRGVCSGHTMNHKLLQALFADRSAWRTVILGEAPSVGCGTKPAAWPSG